MSTVIWEIPGGAHTRVDYSSIDFAHQGRFGLRLLFPYFLEEIGWWHDGTLFLGVRSYRWATTRLLSVDALGNGHT